MRLTDWYANRMSQQLAVRLSDQTVRSLDGLIRRGTFATRTEAIRIAIDLLVATAQRRDIDASIVAGYRRSPDDPNDPWLDAATTAMIAAEPW